ncbi:iron ABC transporter permease [Ectothiorhodospira haloalkaliphila]|uniref:FecCD family ABC transporter permease n=1 Tax=Ectothiorhodospira haloalkaliphila TaxID=421628 RepID=UPI001EE8EBEB|nr:iron ABC transporter permease [Ectothiorhodospira haloalkaliphila]MCG5525390.1 iron ABC transporter permease [Ectothiorhodospira haloalkaliphila]
MSAVAPEWVRAGPTAKPEGSRSARARLVTLALVPAVILAAMLGLTTGAVAMTPWDVLRILTGQLDDPFLREVIFNLRLPRVLVAITVGAALAMSGVALQGLFRNPLADPGLIGVSAGAALGAVAVIVLGTTVLAPLVLPLGVLALPLAAFAGGLATTWLVYRLASRGGHTSVATLLLGGIAINAIAGAATGMLVYMADDQQLRTLTFWNMGSLAHAGWALWAVSAGFVVLALAALPFIARALNGLMLGESVATHLGFPVHRIKTLVVITAALAVGASVAIAGIIGFVGLVVPHLLRLTIGPDHRYLLPASALGGALLLLLADALARVIVSPAELPIGLLTALLGGPFFLWLLMRQQGRLG